MEKYKFATQATSGAHCHQLVASVAVNAAAELYETLMGDNVMYEAWRKRNPGAGAKALARRFISDNWGKCIPVARTTLAAMLRDPTIAESLKEQIVEALALDSSLMKGRQNPAQVVGSTTTESKA